jgi:hypothetical protein
MSAVDLTELERLLGDGMCLCSSSGGHKTMRAMLRELRAARAVISAVCPWHRGECSDVTEALAAYDATRTEEGGDGD